MSRITERKSNFELLRIAAMLMIVAYHLVCHGVQRHVLSVSPTGNRLFQQFLMPGGDIGVALFFMLTGYFLVGKQRTSVLKVCLQTIFYGLALSALFVIMMVIHKSFGVGYAFSEFSLTEKITQLLRHIFVLVSAGNWWFVSAYVLLVLTAPRINQFLATLNKAGFARLLLVTWFFFYSYQLVFDGAYVSLGRAFFFYILGAYCRLFVDCEPKKPKMRHVVLFALGWLLFVSCAFWSDDLGEISVKTASAMQAIKRCVLVGLMNCISIPLCSWSLFIVFARMSVPPSRRINTVAATTFGVYLLHDSHITRQLLWNGILHVSDAQFLSPYFPLLALVDILAVFAVCSAIDYLRLRLVEPKMLAWAEQRIARAKEKYGAC